MAAFGAEIVLTPQTGGMEMARDVAEKMRDEGKGVILDQFANPDNPLAHYESTGPEIWRDTDGKITHFVSSMGTTGTIMGVSRYLKEKNPAVQIVGCQPTDGSQIPGIRKWPAAYLPKICDWSRARRGHIRRRFFWRRHVDGVADLSGGHRCGDRHHHLRPRRPLFVDGDFPCLSCGPESARKPARH